MARNYSILNSVYGNLSEHNKRYVALAVYFNQEAFSELLLKTVKGIEFKCILPVMKEGVCASVCACVMKREAFNSF